MFKKPRIKLICFLLLQALQSKTFYILLFSDFLKHFLKCFTGVATHFKTGMLRLLKDYNFYILFNVIY